MVDARDANPDPSIGVQLAQGFASGLVGAIATGAGALGGDLVGAWLYPQKYEGFPSILLFFPLALIVGFFVGGSARLAKRQWNTGNLLRMAALSGFVAALLMFGRAQSNAKPPQFELSFEPYKPAPERCRPEICPQDNPPLDWTFAGRINVRAIRLSGTVDAIEMTALAVTVGHPRPGDPVVLAEATGPTLRLSGEDLAGPREIRSGKTVSYPVRYSYRSRQGPSERSIMVRVLYTDTSGRPLVSVTAWQVQ